jgi:UDP-N-acetylglucosamine diphosphorylase/glucosamine-1-phosphate N-acetyltransferase
MAFDKIVLFDPEWRNQLLPLAFTRSIAACRVGILTIAEKWSHLSGTAPGILTTEYLQCLYPVNPAPRTIFINAALLPGHDALRLTDLLQPGESLWQDDVLIALYADEEIHTTEDLSVRAAFGKKIPVQDKLTLLQHPWDIFTLNGRAIAEDIQILGLQPSADRLPASNRCLHPEHIYVEAGAKAEHAIFNASEGPIYLGKDSEVMEGSMIRGAFALGEHAVLKMGTKIYSNTTIGPHSKVGGEINNSVIFGYSNKAHDGFLGNSVLGEWCNLGADTNNSNLKNNYSPVKAYSYAEKGMVDTALQFCGLIMGDHSKCGINTMFNTGTVAGVCANIFGGGFPPKFIPSFSWGGAEGWEQYAFSKAMETAEKVMERRGIALTGNDRRILQHIFSLESKHFS